MTKNEKQELKVQIYDYLSSHGINTEKPFKCINPEHSDEHPSMSIDKKRHKAHCFSCGADYDLYDCIRLLEGFISEKEAFEYAENRYLKHTTFVAKSDSDINSSLQGKFLSYVEKRGISVKTAMRFGLVGGEKIAVGENTFWDCIIIPVNKNSFVFRNINETDKKNRIRKKGASTIFNISALSSDIVFIVEGEFDALSIEEVGGNAIALGSTSNYRQLFSHLENLEKKPFIVLSLDNDKDGKRTQKIIADYLRCKNISFVEQCVSGAYKDANEALIHDKDLFTSTVQEITSSEKGYISSEKLLYQKKTAIDVLKDLKTDKCIPTSMPKLDTVLDGGLYNELYILGGSSSVGKTSFILQIIDNIALYNDVLLFSLEMSKRNIVAKSISRLTTEFGTQGQTTSRQITSLNETLSKRQENAIEKSIEKYKKIGKRVYINEGSSTHISNIIKDVESHITFTGNKPVVFIDYLQLIETDNKNSDKQNVDKCVKELKRMSRKLDLPVVAISSFSRAGYKEEASMESFKESGSIEYSGDVLLALQFQNMKHNFNINEAKRKEIRDVEIVILKNRNGSTGDTIPYCYHSPYNLFTED